MLHVQNFTSDAGSEPQHIHWAEHRQGNRLDCETGALLRQVLFPHFAEARDWSELQDRLRTHGLDLRFEGENLILVETRQGEKVCSCRFLGHTLSDLAARLGRVKARPSPTGDGFGTLAVGPDY